MSFWPNWVRKGKNQWGHSDQLGRPDPCGSTQEMKYRRVSESVSCEQGSLTIHGLIQAPFKMCFQGIPAHIYVNVWKKVSCFKMATSLWVDLSSYIPWLRQYKTIYHESNYSFSFSFDHLIQNPSSFQTKKCFQRHPAAVRTLCFCVSVFLYSRADRERDYSGELNLTGGEKRDNDNHNHTVRWCQRSYGG